MLTKTTLPPSEQDAEVTEAQRAADDPIMPAPTTANLCFIVPHNTAVFFETEAFLVSLLTSSYPHPLLNENLPTADTMQVICSTEKKAGQVSPTDPTSAHLRHHLS